MRTSKNPPSWTASVPSVHASTFWNIGVKRLGNTGGSSPGFLRWHHAPQDTTHGPEVPLAPAFEAARLASARAWYQTTVAATASSMGVGPLPGNRAKNSLSSTRKGFSRWYWSSCSSPSSGMQVAPKQQRRAPGSTLTFALAPAAAASFSTTARCVSGGLLGTCHAFPNAAGQSSASVIMARAASGAYVKACSSSAEGRSVAARPASSGSTTPSPTMDKVTPGPKKSEDRHRTTGEWPAAWWSSIFCARRARSRGLLLRPPRLVV
mmetsp:Transcript_16021/g.32792  ORF Transcript_16021/g.32792 Transcript_16021/m.32792 type:complete len:265 (+) Transcript_16021:139-933(+)